MNNYYFTFGIGQTILKTYFVKIEANTEDEARDIMFTSFGNKWCWCYPEDIWKQEKIEETYGYTELKW